MSYFAAKHAQKNRGTSRYTRVLEEPMIREILMSRLVRGEPTKDIAARLGVGAETVRRLVSGGSHAEARSRCIRELRAEGYVVNLDIIGSR